MATETPPKSKLEIIEEITSYFANDPSKRAFKNFNAGTTLPPLPRCAYFDPETKNRCAVGMCIKDECFQEDADGEPYLDLDGSALDVAVHLIDIDQEAKEAFEKSNANNEEESYDRALDVILKEEYRGHSTGFWEDLQVFHDSNENFDSNGLTSSGKEGVNKLIARWGQG